MDVIAVGPLAINRREFRALLHGRPLHLTRTEFALLWTLASDRERVFTRVELQHLVLGGGLIQQVRTIDVHIRNLRIKLREFADSIETVRGIGYRLTLCPTCWESNESDPPQH